MPFTGIIEEMGTIESSDHSTGLTLWDGSKGEGYVLKITCSVVTEGAYIGCSIAVNGTCLTVTEFTATEFTVNCAPETLRRTNLGAVAKGSKVNLERAMLASDRNSGHCVQGHVDGTGTIASKKLDGEALWVTITVPPNLIKYIVEKGYIAIDGTSLTVCTVDRAASQFSVMLIAHTQQCIILPLKADGDQVNIEVDVLSKYVEASVGPRLLALEAKVFGASAETPPATEPAAWTAPTPSAAAGANAGVKGSDGEMRSINAQVVVKSSNLHGAGLQVPMPSRELASTMKIGIIRTCWHSEHIDLMESKCIEALLDGGVKKENVLRSRVSGSFELPYTAQRMIRQFKVDAVVTIGILLKGGTIHMEVIANAVTKSILDIQQQEDVPIIFGVLTVFSMDQAKERAESDLGGSWGQAALCQGMWHKLADGDEQGAKLLIEHPE